LSSSDRSRWAPFLPFVGMMTYVKTTGKTHAES